MKGNQFGIEISSRWFSPLKMKANTVCRIFELFLRGHYCVS